jgi:hypothetical protein
MCLEPAIEHTPPPLSRLGPRACRSKHATAHCRMKLGTPNPTARCKRDELRHGKKSGNSTCISITHPTDTRDSPGLASPELTGGRIHGFVRLRTQSLTVSPVNSAVRDAATLAELGVKPSPDGRSPQGDLGLLHSTSSMAVTRLSRRFRRHNALYEDPERQAWPLRTITAARKKTHSLPRCRRCFRLASLASMHARSQGYFCLVRRLRVTTMRQRSVISACR